MRAPILHALVTVLWGAFVLAGCAVPNPAYHPRRPPAEEAAAAVTADGPAVGGPDGGPGDTAPGAGEDGAVDAPADGPRGAMPDGPPVAMPDAPLAPPDTGPDTGRDTGPPVSTNGLALYWTLDDPSATSTVAMDSSGQQLHGTYTGVTGMPTPSTMVPTVAFAADLGSRAFVAASDQAVFVTMPPALKPLNNVTVAAWYRSTVTDTRGISIGEDVINAGNHYVLRIRATQIEFSKKRPGAGFVQCLVAVPNHLDGQWHHLAGVTTPAAMKLYFDGGEVCSAAGDDISYNSAANELWVGRHATQGIINSFDGNIDEVRVYTRGLMAAEILSLAQGGK